MLSIYSVNVYISVAKDASDVNAILFCVCCRVFNISTIFKMQNPPKTAFVLYLRFDIYNYGLALFYNCKCCKYRNQ